jgi:hypothetical protein
VKIKATPARSVLAGAARFELAVWLPPLGGGSIGVLLGHVWGYALWAAAVALSVVIKNRYRNAKRAREPDLALLQRRKT